MQTQPSHNGIIDYIQISKGNSENSRIARSFIFGLQRSACYEPITAPPRQWYLSWSFLPKMQFSIQRFPPFSFTYNYAILSRFPRYERHNNSLEWIYFIIYKTTAQVAALYRCFPLREYEICMMRNEERFWVSPQEATTGAVLYKRPIGEIKSKGSSSWGSSVTEPWIFEQELNHSIML